MVHHSRHLRQYAISQNHAQTRKWQSNGRFCFRQEARGTLQGNVLHFIARDGYSTIECTATLSGGTISGKFVETFPNDPKDVQESTISATCMPAPRSGP